MGDTAKVMTPVPETPSGFEMDTEEGSEGATTSTTSDAGEQEPDK